MAREWDLSRDTDGKKYGPNDMAKVACDDCRGCDMCCHDMCESILVDPWDLFMLQKGTGMSVDDLFTKRLEMGQVNGLIMPHIRMAPNVNGCGFLSGEGRCTIHEYRPGLCRLFPIARLYEGDTISYVRLVNECPAENTTKIKVKKWIDFPELAKHEAFALRWHDLTRGLQARFLGIEENENGVDERSLNLLFLQTFYLSPYDLDLDFYEQIESRFKAFSGHYHEN